MDQDISTTASSWAWVLGPAGDMAMAGATIASVTAVAEVIAAEAEQWPIAAVLRVVAEQNAAGKGLLLGAAVVRHTAAHQLPMQE
jgi:hypothetical protein